MSLGSLDLSGADFPRPDVIVECGVNYGGSALYYAALLDLLDHGEILAVDITLSRVYPQVKAHRRITLFEPSSTERTIVDIIRKRAEGRRTMVILDSDHSLQHVRQELSLYAGLVSRGCYLIVEDTIVNGHRCRLSTGLVRSRPLKSFSATGRISRSIGASTSIF